MFIFVVVGCYWFFLHILHDLFLFQNLFILHSPFVHSLLSLYTHIYILDRTYCSHSHCCSGFDFHLFIKRSNLIWTTHLFFKMTLYFHLWRMSVCVRSQQRQSHMFKKKKKIPQHKINNNGNKSNQFSYWCTFNGLPIH